MHLAAKSHSNFFHQGGIPGGSKQGGDRESGRVISFRAIIIPYGLYPHTSRSISYDNRRDPETRDGIGGSCCTRHLVLCLPDRWSLWLLARHAEPIANHKLCFFFQR